MLGRVLRSVCAYMLFFCLLASYAYAVVPKDVETPRVVRIAFPFQSGLTQKDEYGRYSGYTYDYLQEIAQYTGWEYEFVEIPGPINVALTKSLELLESGAVDLVGGLLRNEQTEQLFQFPEYGYGSSYTALFLPENNTRINENNFHEIPLLRIAHFRNAANVKAKLDAFCKINNISYELLEFDTEEEINQAITDGRADVRISSNLAPLPGMRLMAQFDGAPFYFAASQGDNTLVPELNRSILAIKQAKPYFEVQLYERYFSAPPTQLYFTHEEQQYIASSQPIRVVLPQSLPMQAINEDSGQAWGISVDILRRAEALTGLSFTFLSAPSYKAALAMVDSGEADAICGIPYDYELARAHGLLISNPILSAPGVMVVRQKPGSSAAREVAVVNRQASEAYLFEPLALYHDTAQQCMDSVVQGKADSAFLCLYSAEYLSNFTPFKSLQLIPQPSSNVEYCLGIKKAANTELVSILNKAVSSLSHTELETIVQQNMGRYEQQVTLQAFIQENPFASLGIAFAFFLVVLAAGALIFWFRLRSGALLAVENQRYARLYELANEYIYEYDFQQDLLTLSKSFAEHFGLPERLTGFRSGSDINESQPGILEHLRNLQDDASGEEMLCALPSGGGRWFRNIFAKICDESNQPLYYIGKLMDVQSEIEERAELKHRLQLDGLTGLYNAVSVKHIIGGLLQHPHGAHALLILDIDYFKAVNDHLGHYIGDNALCDLAALLKELSASHDILGRLGGDEFVVFLTDVTSPEQVENFCANLCSRARRIYTNAGVSRPVSVSIGAVFVRRSCSFLELYQATDKLLYASKEAGRDRFTLSELDDVNS